MMTTCNSPFTITEEDALFASFLPGYTRTSRDARNGTTYTKCNALQPRHGVKKLKPIWDVNEPYFKSVAKMDIIGNTRPNSQYLSTLTRVDFNPTAWIEDYDDTFSYTNYINGWAYAHDLVYEETHQRQGLYNGLRIWEYQRAMRLSKGTMIGYGMANTIANAKYLCDYAIYKNYLQERPRVQMDGNSSKESVQGQADQQSESSSNTIVTRDEGATTSDVSSEIKALDYCSTEQIVTMPYITERWMPLSFVKVSTTDKYAKLLKSYYLPETLYGEMGQAVNLLPFESFIYGKYDVEFKFVTNANKFQCGKLLVSCKFDSYQADALQDSVQSALCRPHVMIDLATNVEAKLNVPFRYHRTMLRNVKNDAASVGIRPSKYASVYMHVLSPLRSGKDGSTDMYIRPFVRIHKAQFAGMSYRVAVQMDTLAPVLKAALPTQEVRDVLRTAERLLKTIGETKNRDKPTTMEAMVTIPRTRLNFGTGKGLVDAIPLRNNPYAMTTFTHVQPFEDEPKTMLDIAQIWGLRNSTIWKQGSKPGELLFDVIVDPSTRSYDADYDGTPTPLEYVCNMYAFWAGTIEFRIDFISNAFHTGAVMFAAEFGRPSGGVDERLAASTYTKTFHLGEQKSVHFTVPYIYDTVWRRNNNAVFNPIFDTKEKSTDKTRQAALDIMAKVRTHFRAYVINELRPIQTAPLEIEMLIYWRASPQFMVHGLCQQSFVNKQMIDSKIPAMDRFPYDGYEPKKPVNLVPGSATETNTQSKRSTSAKAYHDAPNATEWNEVPHVQMDDGSKEDEDETEDFNQGKFNLALQTTDSQVSLKDILRRPTLLLLSKKVNGYVTGKTHGFFIPLMPPSRQMQYEKDKTDHIWSEMLGQTPQAAIMNMFRFWRGTMRYTIVVETTSDAMVYITHVPHTGTRLFGNMSIMGSETTSQRPLFASGLSTEVLSPILNNSAVFEAPYDTELDWTLTFEEDPQRNYAWRDKGDSNAGHICIQSKSDCTITVFWSAGDDFEIGNFYGIPAGVQKDSDKLYTDEHARVQMEDFKSNEGSYSRKLFNVVKESAIPAALHAIPVVGSAMSVAYTHHKVAPVLNQARATLHSIEQTAQQATSVANHIENGMTQVVRDMHNVAVTANETMSTLKDQLTSAMETIMGKLTVAADHKIVIENAVIDVITAWMAKSWVVVGCGVVRIVHSLLGGTMAIFQYGTQIAAEIGNYFSANPVVQADNTKTLVGILCAMVSAISGVYVDPANYNSRLRAFAKIFTSATGMAHLNQVIRFVQVTFDTLKELVMDAIGLVDPEVVAIKALCSNSQMISTFVNDAQQCMNEANGPMMLAPQFRTKFWSTVLRAYQIQKALTCVPSNMARPMLNKVCSDVIKAGTEKFVDLSCSPVRYEPMVVCIEGPSQIGKSYLVDELAERMMQKIGFNRAVTELTYTRSVGSKYWSSYRNQPVVVYDDWLNINSSTSIEQQLSELYQLKTTNKFIPEMANIEEKRLSANPLAVMLVCNDAFPSGLSNIAPHPEAVLRRRDLVFYVELKPEYEGKNLRDVLTEEESKNFKHLRFALYFNSRDERSCSSNMLNYEEFIDYFLATYERYHRQEQINVRKRVERLERRLCLAPGQMLGDPFEMLYTAQNEEVDPGQNAWLPSEQLEMAVLDLVNAVERGTTREDIVVPPVPENPFVQFDFGIWDCAKWAISGLATTPSFLAWIAEQTIETLSAVDLEVTSESTVYGRCAVCFQDDQQLVMECGANQSETSHSTCLACYNQALSANATLTCPMCRSTNYNMVVTRTGKFWMVIANWIIKFGKQYVKPLITHFIGIGRMLPLRAVYWINTLSAMVRAIANPITVPSLVGNAVSLAADMSLRPDADVFVEASQVPLATANIIMANVAMNYTVQMDHVHNPFLPPEGYVPEERVVEEPRVVSILEPAEFREDVYDAMEVRNGVCLHDEVLSAVHSVRLVWNPTDHEQCWQLAITQDGHTFMANVPNTKCNLASCPFADRERYEAFIARYVSLNLIRIRQNLVTCYNQRTGGQRDIALSGIPPTVVPTWLQAPVVQTYELSWWEYLEGTYAKYKTFINICLGIGGVLTSLYAGTKLWSYLTNGTTLQSDANYNVSEARQMRRIVNPRQIRPIRVQADELSNVVVNAIYRNYVTLKIWKDGKCLKQLGLVGICGHYAMLPRHYLKALDAYEDYEMTIEPTIYANGEKNHLSHRFVYDRDSTTQMANTDLAMIKLPNSTAMFRDIRRFFQTDKEMQGYYPNTGDILLIPTRTRQYLATKSVDFEGIEQQIRFDDSDDSSFWASGVLKYNHSENGACGSLVIVHNHQHPIRAMHVAGCDRTGSGYGVVISQEMIDELVGDKIQLQYEQLDLEEIADRSDAIVWDNDVAVDYLGALPKEKVPHIPTKSKIMPSLIAPKLPPTQMMPGILSSSDKRYIHEKSPLYYGAAKHGIRSKDFKPSEIQEAREALWDVLIKPMKPAVLKPKRMTPEEAIVGIAGTEYYEPMRLDTSAGWPWSQEGSDTTKNAWCQVKRDEHGEVTDVIIDDRLREEIARKEKLRKEGIVPATIFVDTLKDERRKKTKAMKAGGTRVFCACPVDYTISCRQNVLHFCAAFMKARLSVDSAVGINAKGTEWTELFRKLTSVSPKNIVTMDYSNFGPAFNAQVSEAVVEIMVRWLLENVEGVDETELRALLQELINSLHVAGPTVYRQFAGSPSGAPITTIINTLVNLMYLFLAWRALCKKRARTIHADIYQVFKKFVAKICYGDDFIMAVDEMFADIFNTNTIREYFASHNIAATSADKELVIMPDFVNITEASFLKRFFRKHDTRPGMVLGPLDTESLEEIPKWIWKCQDLKAATKVNVESALMEAHAHGIVYFEQFKNTHNEALAKLGITPCSMQWASLDEMWFENTMSVVQPLVW